jgi:hypothetical protein
VGVRVENVDGIRTPTTLTATIVAPFQRSFGAMEIEVKFNIIRRTYLVLEIATTPPNIAVANVNLPIVLVLLLASYSDLSPRMWGTGECRTN